MKKSSDSSVPIHEIADQAGNLLAIIFSSTGVQESGFVTPADLQQQVAIMKRSVGERIPAHTHLPVPRAVRGTQEVLIIRSGTLRADIYDAERSLVSSRTLTVGDIIILVSGGHGFTMLDDCEFVEVKQGPFVIGRDKEVFEPTASSET